METEDEQLALAIAVSQREADEEVKRRRVEIEAFQDDGDGLAFPRMIHESAEQAVANRKREEEENLLEEIQVDELVAETIRERRRHEDAQLAADLELNHALAASQEESRVRDSLEKVAAPFTREERDDGCWDCVVCTFHNEPYAPNCKACHQPPPPHILTFSKIPDVQFGVEFELIISDGLHDGYSCDWLAKEVTKLGVPTSYSGYTHATSNQWKVVTDASLSSSIRDLCCEIVSPILCGEDGLKNMRILLETIRKLGIDVNATCGFHVHVDAEPSSYFNALSTLRGTRRLCQSFVAVERAFDSLVATRRRQANRNNYCRSNRLVFGSLSNKGRWSRIGDVGGMHNLVEMVSPDRYRKLNLTNLTNPSRPSTIEFRQHGGVDKLLTAEAWVRLVLKFCERVLAISTDQLRATCRLPQNATELDELEALFQLIDCNGLRSYYTLDRSLFPTTTVVQTWRCDTCKRLFRDSRSLAQHADATGHWLHY